MYIQNVRKDTIEKLLKQTKKLMHEMKQNLEKVKKQQNIHTYKEIVAFANGEKLDNIEKAREEGKRNYQMIIAAVACAALGLGVAWIISLII